LGPQKSGRYSEVVAIQRVIKKIKFFLNKLQKPAHKQQTMDVKDSEKVVL
jgi:hypothetical protein